jgi:hypothetical protein
MRKCVVLLIVSLLCVMNQHAFSATSNDYFPLKPETIWQYQVDGQEGNIVTRKVLDKKVLVNGVETSVVKYIDEKLRVFFSSDSNGIYLHRQIFREAGRNFNVIFVPPLKFGNATFEVGDSFHSEGNAITSVAGRTFYFYYTAGTSVEGTESIPVPAGTFDTIRVKMDLTLTSDYGDFTITSIQNFAKDIGIVKEVTIDTEEGLETVEELVYTNANIYDLAITSIAQPKRVVLSAETPSKTSLLKVKLRNRGPFEETIEDTGMLTNLIAITVDSLDPGTCPAPAPILHEGKPQKLFPIMIKPGKTLTVYYDVTFDCPHDATRDTPDFRFSAKVNRATIDEKEDTNPADDVCPRDSTSPIDKGCGARKPDHTLGGEILTDVVVK